MARRQAIANAEEDFQRRLGHRGRGRMSTIEDGRIDLLDGYLYAGDPEPTYDWLRTHAPVYRDETNGIWGISRYRDVMAVETDAVRYSSAHGSRPRLEDSSSMINMDDPAHHQFRQMVSRQFTPRAVKRFEDRVRERVTELIDAVCERGCCDVVHDLAAPLPATLIGERLGYPPELCDRVVYWSETTMQLGGGPAYVSTAGMKAAEDFGAATWQLIQERRAEPKEDLISVWCHQEVGGRLMTDAEIISEALLVLDGGAETTRSVIGSATLALIEHPDERAKLIEDPSIIGATGVEEFIRWVTPILNMRRTATVDHELQGQAIRAGDELLLMYSA